MKRREFLIGTAATASVVALPRPASAFAPIAHDIANVLRDAVRGGVLSTAECRARPKQQYYDVTMRGCTTRTVPWGFVVDSLRPTNSPSRRSTSPGLTAEANGDLRRRGR